MDKESEWNTALSHVEPNKILIRGYPVEQVMGKLSFAGAVYLLWTGKVPAPPVERLLNAIMIGSMDHGASPPSVVVGRNVASTGAPLNACIAAGILAFNKYHGAAVGDAMAMIYEVEKIAEKNKKSLDLAAKEYIEGLKVRGIRASGLGHRLHSEDPRTKTLFNLAGQCEISGRYIKVIEALRDALAKQLSRPVPINIDGTMAACLCEIGFPPDLGNPFFIICRAAGVAIQSWEEQQREKPMRKIAPSAFGYDGPPQRNLKPET
ncbi:MAG: citryl-CoA lyase [Elusimicrobia bacterium]|nr:citryl-CoA lyase [Elusimicrobiota bacterium]